MSKEFDIICLGRAGVDIYAEQIGARLEDVQSFSKYIGGSSCNIAYGTARLGLKSSMLTRVGNEHLGRFITETLSKGGVDVSHIKVDPKRLSGLAILGIKSEEVFPLVFYRKDCADMALAEEDIDENYLKKSRSLLITGTHLSTDKTSRSSKKALKLAKKNQLKTILDIDYRPVLWGLTDLDRGEDRFVSSNSVSKHLQSFISYFDLIVGTEEEFKILGGSDDIILSLKAVRNYSDATLVLKRGAEGNSVIQRNDFIPHSLKEISFFKGLKVKVLNVLGAGDAFLSGFLKGWLEEKNSETCSLYANACGALTVSRHGCSPAIPSWVELEYYLQNRLKINRIDQDENLNYLHKATNRIYHDYLSHKFIILNLSKMYEMIGKTLSEENKINQFNQSFISVLNQLSNKENSLSEDLWFGLGYTFPNYTPSSRYEKVLHSLTGKKIFLAITNQNSSNGLNKHGSFGSKIIAYPQEHIIKYDISLGLTTNNYQKIIKELENDLDELKKIFIDCLKFNRSLLVFLTEGIFFSELFEADKKALIIDAIKLIYKKKIKPDWWQFKINSLKFAKEVYQLIYLLDPYLEGLVINFDEGQKNNLANNNLNKEMTLKTISDLDFIARKWNRAIELQFPFSHLEKDFINHLKQFSEQKLSQAEIRKNLMEFFTLVRGEITKFYN